MKNLIIAAAALALTGCASITGNKAQPLTVTTTFENKEIAGVSCTLSNDAGNWTVTTPGTATVNKSTAALVINCKQDTLIGNSSLESSANVNVWGNIIVGGVIGYVVDRQTGAGFDYPNTVAVALRPIGTPAAPVAPAAAPAARTTATETAPQAAVPGRAVAGAPL
ncbi:hypothetical protein E7V67_023395 [[Empedobacter] haloabium]|uniref:Lipoprotein n=1 Tax=[Empedobacter] haloabium TaxID=592317 RepID=A0ABZ1UIP0_9BURK